MVIKEEKKMEPKLVCPWWLAYTFDNPLRKLFHDPVKMLGAHIQEGMTVMDLGCGMGYFTFGMALMVGPRGRVIAVDIQEKMLEVMKKRAIRRGLIERIKPHLASLDRINVNEKVDFALAMWMAHEVPDQEHFFSEIKSALKPQGKFLMVEPRMHVKPGQFESSLRLAAQVGLIKIEEPKVNLSFAAIFKAA
jgi:ubiquinone/menaquinone biosynthesis C-methylase UbiE